MKDKIIFWLDSNLTQFCLAYFLQKELDSDFYAIIDATNKTRSFFENQNLVNFKKIWFLHDHTLPLQKPDLDYLSLFEKTHNIELWKLAINDRIFNHHNDFHNFSRDEILSIIENESKLIVDTRGKLRHSDNVATVGGLGQDRDLKKQPLNKKEIKNLKKKRDSNIVWMNDRWIYKEIQPYIKEANRRANWNFNWDW